MEDGRGFSVIATVRRLCDLNLSDWQRRLDLVFSLSPCTTSEFSECCCMYRTQSDESMPMPWTQSEPAQDPAVLRVDSTRMTCTESVHYSRVVKPHGGRWLNNPKTNKDLLTSTFTLTIAWFLHGQIVLEHLVVEDDASQVVPTLVRMTEHLLACLPKQVDAIRIIQGPSVDDNFFSLHIVVFF